MLRDSNSSDNTYNPLIFAFSDLQSKEYDLNPSKANQTYTFPNDIFLTPNQGFYYIFAVGSNRLLYIYLEFINIDDLWYSCKDNIGIMPNYMRDNITTIAIGAIPKQDISSIILPINYKDIVSESIKSFWSSDAMNGLAEIQDAENKEEELKSNIINAFKQIDEVESIYVQKYTYEWKVIILLNIKKHDDKLMDRLLDIEYDLQNRDEDPLLDFSYIPKIYNNKWDILHPSSLPIFER